MELIKLRKVVAFAYALMYVSVLITLCAGWQTQEIAFGDMWIDVLLLTLFFGFNYAVVHKVTQIANSYCDVSEVDNLVLEDITALAPPCVSIESIAMEIAASNGQSTISMILPNKDGIDCELLIDFDLDVAYSGDPIEGARCTRCSFNLRSITYCDIDGNFDTMPFPINETELSNLVHNYCQFNY